MSLNKLKNYFFLYLLIQSLSIPLIARSNFDLSSVTVKVTSSLCKNNPVSLKGTGILFREKSDVYVLTVEHSVLNSTDSQFVCQNAFHSQFGEIELELIQSEWSVGLALLKVKNPSIFNQTSLPQVSDFQMNGVEVGSQVIGAGFPQSSQEIRVQEHGTIATFKSDRLSLPSLKETIELSGAIAETGYSGSPIAPCLTSTKDSHSCAKIVSQILGLIFHWHPVKKLGSPSDMAELGKETSTTENQFLAIPASVIQNWITETLSDSPETLSKGLFRSASYQAAGREALFSEGLKFELLPKESSDLAEQLKSNIPILECRIASPAQGSFFDGAGVGSGDGAGVGSGDGAGVGSGDGAGVTSGMRNTILKGPLKLVVTLEPHASQFRWPYSNSLPLIQKIKQSLLLKGRVEIPYFIKNQRRYEFSSLMRFFEFWTSQESYPIIFQNSPLNLSKDPSDAMRTLQTLANSLQNLTARFSNSHSLQFMSESELLILEMFRLIQESSCLALQNSIQYIDFSKFEEMTSLDSRFEKAWNEMHLIDVETSSQIYLNLMKMKEEIKKFKIN